MADGVELAATLYLPPPGSGPQPCLLEALPYRKDDLTVVVRRRVPGAARRPTATRWPARPARHRLVGGRRHRRVPARGAARPGRRDRLARRPGVVRRQRRHVRHVVLRVQLAADRLRAPAGAQGDLRDLRHRRPLHRRRALRRWRAAAGRPRRLLPLHDADVRAAPVPAVWGDGWQEEWRRRLETNEPWVLTLARASSGTAPTGASGPSVRLDRTARATTASRPPDDDRRGVGRRLPQQHLPDRRGARGRTGSRTGCSPGRGRTRTPRARCRAPGSTSTPRWPGGSTAGCAAGAGTRTAVTLFGAARFVRTSTRPEPDLDLHDGLLARASRRSPPRSGVALDLAGPRSLAVDPEARHRRVDRLCRRTCPGGSRATSDSTTPGR